MSIESYPNPNGVLTSLIWRKTAVGGEASLSGYDNASQALSYTPGQEQVYLNGILLVRGSDYTATNGTSITGLTALTADDFVQVNCYNNFSVASVPAASITGTVTNSQLANSSITINGSAVSLGGSVSLPGDIESVTASSPLTGGGSTGALTIGIQSASTSQVGAVQLSDSTSTTSSVLAATPTAVKSAYDLANGAIPKTLTTTTGDIIYASGANTPARLGIGSTGQVLTVASGIPSWAAGGGMVQLGTTTLSGTSYTFSAIPQSGYRQLYLEITGPNASTAFDLNVEPQRTDGTGGFETYSVGHYYIGGGSYTTFTNGNTKEKIRLTYPGSSRATYSYLSTHAITFYNYWNQRATSIATSGYQLDSTSARVVFHQTGSFELENIYNLKINSSATLTGGTATLWGVK